MRDIPVFTTEFGVASLTLSQIPYTKQAYIRFQDTLTPKEFLAECVGFCKAAGAEAVFATGHKFLESYPLHTEIWKMSCLASTLPETDAHLFPIQDSTFEKWRELYNERMRFVPNAALLSAPQLRQLLAKQDAYFVHKDGCCIGVGIVSGSVIEGLVATQKGMGFTVLCALRNAMFKDVIEVEVASANLPAVRLYEKAGFIKTEELSRWYKVF